MEGKDEREIDVQCVKSGGNTSKCREVVLPRDLMLRGSCVAAA